ncbi:MAG: hypothetical protein AAF489_13395 [Bacteroidota bacterium]
MEHISEQQLWNYILKEESLSNSEAVKAHLESCEQCQWEYDFHLKLHTSLFEQLDSSPGLEFSNRVVDKIRKYQNAEKASKFSLRFAKYSIVVAMVLAVLVPLVIMLVGNVELPEDFGFSSQDMLIILSVCFLPWAFYGWDRLLKTSYKVDASHF